MQLSGYKKGKPDIAWWIGQLKYGIKWRKRFSYESEWDLWRSWYRNDFGPRVLPNNIFYRTMRSAVPRIYFRNPSVSIQAGREGLNNMVLAQLLEQIDNNLIRDMDIKNSIKAMVQNAWMFGTGVGKSGIGSEFALNPADIASGSAPLADGVGNDFRVEYDSRVKASMPWFKKAPTDCLILPHGSIDRESAPWEAFVIKRPLEDVKNDPRFVKKFRQKVGATSDGSLEESQTQYYGHMGEDEIEWAHLFEIRDKRTGKIFVISDTVADGPLIFQPDFFASTLTSNVKTLVFNDNDDTFWGIPESVFLAPLQVEMNEILTFTRYHRRLSVLKVLARKGAVDPDELAKLLSPDPMTAIYTNNQINESVQVVQAGSIPNDLYEAGNLLEQVVRTTVGFSRNEAGEFMGGSRKPTATEVDRVADSAEIRLDERRDRVADLLTEIVQEMHPLIFTHWQEEQVVRVAGPAGVPLWVAFRPEILSGGSYKVKIDPDTSAPETKQNREAKAIQIYGILKENPLINPIELTRYLLHELYGVHFDSMMKGLPEGMGMSQERPMNPGQYMNVVQKSQQMGLPNTTGGA